MLKNIQSKLLIHKYMLKNLQSKLLTLLVLSTVLPVSIIGIYSISSSTQALTELKVNQLENELAQQSMKIEQTLINVHKDVLMLSKVPPIQGIVQERERKARDRNQEQVATNITYQDWVRQTETIFKAVMFAKPQYKTLQYLDEQGNELVTLDAEDGAVLSHSIGSLHNKTKAVYFQPTLELKPEQVYISPVTLKQTSNGINPTEPVIYYATPIYNQLGARRGLIVITLYVKAFTSQLEIENEKLGEAILLITKDGKYLVHPNFNSLWRNNPEKPSTLQADYPTAIADQILNNLQGSIQTNSKRIISYRVVNSNVENHMIVIYDLPQYMVLQMVSQLKRVSIIIIFVALGAVILVGSSIVRRISKRQTSLYQQAMMAASTAEEKARELKRTLDELHHTQTQLVQTEKMSSLGQLVAGVAHEINNPVNFIYGNLSHVNDYSKDMLHLIRVYQHQYPQPTATIQAEMDAIDLDFLMDDLPKILESMKVGSDRIRQIVLSLRNFSRIDEAEMKAVDIHEGIDSTLLILQNRTKAHGSFPGVEIVKNYGNLPLVECYAGQLNQVVMNILSNAIDALEEVVSRDQNAAWQPMITISTEFSTEAKLLAPGSLPTPSIRIRIADNGPGIPPHLRDRLFEPFFTTKPIGKGTGLGLSISYQIITERHGGKLECDSETGVGTEFQIEIPIRQTAIATSSKIQDHLIH